jgi:NAD(P)-dependent dehydrogenase (short-subunit alcohol dehydrogenase family)
VLQRLVREGALNVIAICYTKEGADTALATGARHVLRVDFLVPGEVLSACIAIRELVGGRPLFAILHNAGTCQPGAIDFLTMAAFRRVFEVNFFAVASITSELLPLLKRRNVPSSDCNRIIIVSSVDGLVSLPCNAPYDASKFALEAYADCLRVEQSFWNIFVSVINPSTMKTPLALSFFEGERRSWEEKKEEENVGPGAPSRWQREWSKEWLEQHIEQGSEGLKQIAQDPELVVNDVMHALTARAPKFRYLSGFAAKTLFYSLWVMPESWSFAFKRGIVRPPPLVLGNE